MQLFQARFSSPSSSDRITKEYEFLPYPVSLVRDDPIKHSKSFAISDSAVIYFLKTMDADYR